MTKHKRLLAVFCLAIPLLIGSSAIMPARAQLTTTPTPLQRFVPADQIRQSLLETGLSQEQVDLSMKFNNEVRQAQLNGSLGSDPKAMYDNFNAQMHELENTKRSHFFVTAKPDYGEVYDDISNVGINATCVNGARASYHYRYANVVNSFLYLTSGGAWQQTTYDCGQSDCPMTHTAYGQASYVNSYIVATSDRYSVDVYSHTAGCF